jgi:hypothetical protein
MVKKWCSHDVAEDGDGDGGIDHRGVAEERLAAKVAVISENTPKIGRIRM